MNEMGPGIAERVRRLMMAQLDGEASEAEREELAGLLEERPELKAEWRALTRLKEVTDSMAMRRAPDEVWANYWTSVYSRVERGTGWVLISLGAIVLMVYAVWDGVTALLADTDLPGFVKAAILVTACGGVILLVSAIREKIFLARRQRYKDIER